MASRLIIVGAGSLGREVAAYLRKMPADLSDYEFAGFISDDFSALNAYPRWKDRIISDVAGFRPLKDDLLVMAIAKPQAKLMVAERLKSAGGRFINYIHSTAIVSEPVQMGEGIVICPNVVVSCDVTIEDFVTINLACTLGHDVKVGRGTTLSPHVDLTGFVQVAEGAFFGSHASVLPKGKIGAYACVGAGSVVLRSVKAGSTVIGVPSKQIFP